jgi:hypothetical protein
MLAERSRRSEGDLYRALHDLQNHTGPTRGSIPGETQCSRNVAQLTKSFGERMLELQHYSIA